RICNRLFSLERVSLVRRFGASVPSLQSFCRLCSLRRLYLGNSSCVVLFVRFILKKRTSCCHQFASVTFLYNCLSFRFVERFAVRFPIRLRLSSIALLPLAVCFYYI